MRTLQLLIFCIALPGTHGAAAGNETSVSALRKLQQTGEVSCQPAEPQFCENVHVRCSGRTSVPTFAFKLRATRSAGPVELETTAEEFQRQYENARFEWDQDGGYVMLWPKAANGYVRLLADGKYVFRHYIQSRGVMSLGYCK